MTHTAEVLSRSNIPEQSTGATHPGIVKRLSVLTYGLLAYNIGTVGLFWLILAMGGIAPVGISSLQTNSMSSALLVNIGLIVLFGIQHSVMARPSFKKWLTQFIPEAAERATFMLMSGIVTISAIYFWQTLPGTIWSVESSSGQIMLWALYAIGWTYLLMSTFVTNHFELMGLRQVYLYFMNKPYSTLSFTRKYMYRYSRHPMMLGILIGMWAIPEMSVSHFAMASMLTLYMIIGVYFEEQSLVEDFGETYRNYKKEIAALIPNIF